MTHFPQQHAQDFPYFVLFLLLKMCFPYRLCIKILLNTWDFFHSTSRNLPCTRCCWCLAYTPFTVEALYGHTCILTQTHTGGSWLKTNGCNSASPWFSDGTTPVVQFHSRDPSEIRQRRDIWNQSLPGSYLCLILCSLPSVFFWKNSSITYLCIRFCF